MSEHNFQVNAMGGISCMRCGCLRFTILGTISRRADEPCPGRTSNLAKDILERQKREREALAGIGGRK